MAENTTFETVQRLNQSLYETGQAMTQSALDAQERALRYAQSTFEDGIETLKSHIDATQQWMQRVGQPQEGQQTMQELAQSGADAYRRNVAFWQRSFENGVETFRSNVQATRELSQTVMRKAQEQQATFWSQPAINAYMDLFATSLSYYKRAMDVAQAMTDQTVQTAQRGFEAGQHAAERATDTILTASK